MFDLIALVFFFISNLNNIIFCCIYLPSIARIFLLISNYFGGTLFPGVIIGKGKCHFYFQFHGRGN